jgi:hypothetical protein
MLSGNLKSLVDLWHGIARHPLLTVGYAFTAFSVLFTLAQGIDFFIPSIQVKDRTILWVTIGASVAYGLNKVWKPSRIELSIAHTNTILEVMFGDLFTQEGIRVIAVNDFFDSKLGKPVSDISLHGIFLKKCFGGHPQPFDDQVNLELAKSPYSDIPKLEGKTRRYAIGATALISVNQDKYLTFAFSTSDPTTCKASSDVMKMWDALHCLWQRARIESGGYPVNVPLVGSGLSGVGLPTRDLLNLIILSAITETKTSQITQRIRIVLHAVRFDDIDLRDVKKHWKE